MASGMRPYRDGRIAIENGSTTVTGDGTIFVGNALAGNPVRMPDGFMYVVDQDTNDNTSFEIFPPYRGDSVEDSEDYVLLRFNDRLAAAATQTQRLKDFLDNLAVVEKGTAEPDPALGGVGTVYWRYSGNTIVSIYIKDEDGWGVPISTTLSPELEALRDQIEEWKDDAQAAAQSSATSATTALGYRNAAQAAATAADGSAGEAATSASAASTSETNAAASATAANSSKVAAAASATAADTSKTAAAGSATTASAAATTASSKAGEASTSATNAAASANAASASATSANSAKTGAETASTNADNKAAAASASAASADASATSAAASKDAAAASASSVGAAKTAAETAAEQAQAAAATLNIPQDFVGHSLNILRVKADESGYEFSSGGGDVAGAASSVADRIVTFADTSGKVLKDSGKAIPSGTVVGTSDAQTLTNKTINAANNTVSNLSLSMFASGVIDTDPDLAANSDNKLAPQKAVRSFVSSAISAAIAAQDVEVLKGGIDCSTNPNYPSADAGHVYRVTVAGKIGGASGKLVEVNDRLECFTDGSSSGTHAAVGANWIISQTNIEMSAAGTAMATATDASAQVALLPAVVGDSGSGGSKGLVPAPAAGDAAAHKYLDASGGYSVPAGGSARNRIINPMGQIAQAALAATADGAYAFDQWYCMWSGGSVMPSQLTEPEDGTPFAMRLTQSQATAQRFGIAQPLEAAFCKDMRSKSVALGARLRCSASTTIRFAILSWTGTADVITRDVVNNWGSGSFTAGNFFPAANVDVVATGSIALTADTFADISLSGAFGASLNNAIIVFWTDSAQAQNVTLDVSRVWLGLGNNVPAIFDPPDAQADFLACLRYFWVWDGSAAISQPVTLCYTSSATQARGLALFPAPMRAAPTMTVSAAGDFQASLATSFTLTALSASPITRFGAFLVGTSSGMTANQAGVIRNLSTNGMLSFNARL